MHLSLIFIIYFVNRLTYIKLKMFCNIHIHFFVYDYLSDIRKKLIIYHNIEIMYDLEMIDSGHFHMFTMYVAK